ncbi:MAG TPA: hypothetical protein VLL28_03785 [Hyphomicrobiaceae bacterium]|nr:hypothetical protein [Hyphomicrobiaceae bacterium]
MQTARRHLIAALVLVGIAAPATAGPDAKQFFEQQSRQSGGGM